MTETERVLVDALKGIADYVRLWAKPGTTAEEILKRCNEAVEQSGLVAE